MPFLLMKQTITISYIEPFYCFQNLRCYDFLVPTGRCHQCEAAWAAPGQLQLLPCCDGNQAIGSSGAAQSSLGSAPTFF